MKKIANFLIDRRRILVTVMLLFTVLCGILATTVPINKDRTKYLADDSNMKQGLSVMGSAFPEAEEKASIRVMFDDLTAEEIADVRARLEAIPDVSSVTYDAESEEHNKDNHTLFVVNSRFDYTTDEEKAIEAAIGSSFSDYTVAYRNNDIQSTEVPLWLIAVALLLAVIVLLIMSHSWLDPILFLATIGVAVVINMGTNIVLPYTDELTAVVGPVLQLVLSMDYSIILMSRYRQEKKLHAAKTDAMKAALAGSISSIASSSLTTAAGLLALVFLSFKLGPELGLVLAKGVFISMLCVFTVLPSMILGIDGWLEKTGKKTPHISMGAVSGLSYKVRYLMPLFFLVLLAAFFFLQGKTAITFTEKSDDPLAEVFPKENSVVLIYRSEDEGRMPDIISELEADGRVSSVLGYANTLGREMDAEEMCTAISELGEDSRLGEDVIRMLYYAAADGELPAVTAAAFLDFVTGSVLPNEAFSGYIGEDLTEHVEAFEKFSDPETLTTPMGAEEMAEFFGIGQESIGQLFLYHSIHNGVADSGTMTLPAFVDLVLNTVAADGTYGELFDADALAALAQLQTYTDRDAVQRGYTAAELAELLGMEEATVKTVFVLQNAGDISGRTVTVTEFTDFLCDRMMQDAMFASSFDPALKEQLQTLRSSVQLAASGRELTAGELAQALGMDAQSVSGLFYLYCMNDPAVLEEAAAQKMSLAQFLPLLKANASGEQQAQLMQTEQLIALAVSGEQLDAAGMAAVLGLGEGETAGLYSLYCANDPAFLQEAAAQKMSIAQFLPLLKANAADEQLAQLTQTEQLIALAGSGEQLDAGTLAALLGMDASQVSGVFLMRSAQTMSLREFLEAALQFAPDNAELQQLSSLLEHAVSGTALDAGELAALFGMEPMQVSQLFALSLSAGKTLPLADFTEFLVTAVLADEAYAGSFRPEEAEQLRQLNGLVQHAVSGTALDAGELAALFGMEEALITTVLRLYFGAETGGKTLSLQEFTDFLLADAQVSGMMDEGALEQLRKLQRIMDASVSGTALRSQELAALLDMDAAQTEQLYILHMDESGADWILSPRDFVSFAVTEVLEEEAFAGEIDEASAENLKRGHTLIEAVVSQEALSAGEMTVLLRSLTDDISEDWVELLYLYYGGMQAADSGHRMTIPAFFDYMSGELLEDERFADFFDEETKGQLRSSRSEMDSAAAQMQGEEYSRLVLTSDHPEESPETHAYIEKLDALCEETLGEYYLVGNSVMVKEMDETFDNEYLMITLITAIAVFFVVLVAFRNPTLPLILTLIVQCGVFITVTVIGAYSGSIYYLALLIVQSILMGATIDYGIVFCNYYKENRRRMAAADALRAAYEGSMHTIMTSGAILVLVLAILGVFATAAMISEVCVTLSIGVLVAILLILLVLPGMVACCDRLLGRKGDGQRD